MKIQHRTTLFRTLLALLIGFFTSPGIFAADEGLDKLEDFRGWYNTNIVWGMGQNWLGNVGSSVRTGEGFDSVDQLQFFGALGYRLNENWALWQGFLWQRSDFSVVGKDEYRPFQQLTYKEKYGDWTFSTRSRLEERILDWHAGDVSLRFRQQFRGEYALTDTWYVAGTEEVMFNLNNVVGTNRLEGVDQNRAFAGVGYVIDKNTKIETGYMHRWSHDLTGVVGDSQDNIWQTALNLSF